MRRLFDNLLNKYPMLVRNLGDAGAIVANGARDREVANRAKTKLDMG